MSRSFSNSSDNEVPLSEISISGLASPTQLTRQDTSTNSSRTSSPSSGPRFDKSSSSSILFGRRWFFGWRPTMKTRREWYRRRATVGLGLLVFVFFMVNWWMLSRIQDPVRFGKVKRIKFRFLKANASTVSIKEELKTIGKGKRPQKTTYAKLLSKAANALAEGQKRAEPKDLWVDPYVRAASWISCSYKRDWEPSEGNNGYMMVTANGGINQQRVAVCNAVAVARLLNATLVLPKFMYSSVWKDVSQFGDIYQEGHFIDFLRPDIRIVKELPKDLKSLDLDAVGSMVTDIDIVKEAKPSFYLKNILPILHKNRVVHFVGFGNRLASDPIPFELQRLRCRCNFHALRFIPKIQETGALLIQRMRQNSTLPAPLDPYLVGPFAVSAMKGDRSNAEKGSKYLALHLRFEIDMVAHSLCEFGGGEEERRELEAYREIHFPALVEQKKTEKLPSPEQLRSEGLCPLMPEETALMLAGLGFNRGTHIFLAGAQIYGGEERLSALATLFPYLVTKEILLSTTEMEPYRNFSSQLAALDFIGCAAADLFAMTDSGSQFSSLVSGFRIYYGSGKMPTIRPNKRRLADIFVKKNIQWAAFENRMRKAIRQSKRVFSRPVGRSVYRYPRCRACMCNRDDDDDRRQRH